MKILLTCVIVYTLGLCNGKTDVRFLQPVSPQDGINQESRIIYGYVAQPGQFPHMCSLLIRKTTGVYGSCGGSIISNRHILSAAHCTTDAVSITASCGTVDRNNSYLQVITSNFTAHPQYNSDTFNHDIAILTLSENITYDC